MKLKNPMQNELGEKIHEAIYDSNLKREDAIIEVARVLFDLIADSSHPDEYIESLNERFQYALSDVPSYRH